jgi:acyl carrier protein
MRDLISELNNIFRNIFEDEDLVVRRETTAADVPGWDSLQHVSLILRVESRFGIRLSSSEVADLKSVGDLIDIIKRERHLD